MIFAMAAGKWQMKNMATTPNRVNVSARPFESSFMEARRAELRRRKFWNRVMGGAAAAEFVMVAVVKFVCMVVDDESDGCCLIIVADVVVGLAPAGVSEVVNTENEPLMRGLHVLMLIRVLSSSVLL